MLKIGIFRLSFFTILLSLSVSIPVVAEDTSTGTGTTVKSDKLKSMPEIPGLSDPFQVALYNTLKMSLESDQEMIAIDSKLSAYRSKFKDQNKTSPEALVNFKEGTSTVEGAAAMLEQKQQDLKSLCMAELAWEKKIDERFATVEKLFSALVEAMNNDTYSGIDEFKSAFAQMANFIGDQNATSLVAELAAIRAKLSASSNDLKTDASRKNISSLDFSDKLSQLETMTQESDPVLQNLLGQLDKQSQSKETGATQRFMSGALGMLSYVPGGVGDVADFAQMAYDSGKGAEDAKLLHIVYLYKRAEIRKRVISQVVAQALHNYELASQTSNAFLLSFAKSQISDLAGPSALEQVLSAK